MYDKSSLFVHVIRKCPVTLRIICQPSTTLVVPIPVLLRIDDKSTLFRPKGEVCQPVISIEYPCKFSIHRSESTCAMSWRC